MAWTQNYDPLNSPLLSTLVAMLPIVILLGLLATGRVPAHGAALAGLAVALLAAILVFRPPEASLNDGPGWIGWARTMAAAALAGAFYGLIPIGWIVLAAIYLYSLTVDTGRFEIVKHSVVALSDDRRIQALLIAFCFGAFVEGAAGFGTPVAISAALLLGAGFKPIPAAGLALLANTSPVAFGALGTPIFALSKVTGINDRLLSAMAGRQLPFFSFLVPVVLVGVLSGFRGIIGVWPALLVTGGSFALVQFLVSNYGGPALVDVLGGLVSLVALALFLKFWRPKERWHFPGEEPAPPAETQPRRYTTRQIIMAWTPWAILTVFVFLWGLPRVKEILNPFTPKIEVPFLHKEISRTAPVVAEPKAEEAVMELPWLAATGTGIFLSAVISTFVLGVSPIRAARIFGQTMKRLVKPLLTIACMLALAFTTRYSGMDATLGLAFTRTGVAYPFFAALLGWLGVALTGSDTSSNALFGGLQTITGARLVADGVLPLTTAQAGLLLAAANSTGGVMGKMIDAQSLVVAAVATGQHGQESAILRYVFAYSLALAALMGLLVMVQAYWWTAAIP